MLTEQFVAAIAASTKPNTGVAKDAGIFLHEYQPFAAQRHVFKKSIAAPNCLAISDSHIFVAQDGKAVVHVYSREKGNQEAVVPFPERIRSLALVQKGLVLLLGTESGRIMAWEVCSGRIVSTSTSHLQPVTALAVDPTCNFFLSGSDDSMIYVWSLYSILSFAPDTSRFPIHTLSVHSKPITSLTCGHSHTNANIAVAVSKEKSAIVWNYHTGQALRTYLLPEIPTAVILDPADRAFHVGYEDGSLQTISFYDEDQQKSPIDLLRETPPAHPTVTAPAKSRFNAESQKLGGVLSLSLSWDGTILVSGHSSGKIVNWDIAKGNYLSTLTNLPGPVTNLQFVQPTGFPSLPDPTFKIHTVTKPRQDLSMNSEDGLVPPNYSLNMQFTGRISVPSMSATVRRKEKMSEVEEALTHPIFPTAMLEESLAELETWNAQSSGKDEPSSDFLSFDTNSTTHSESAPDGASQQELNEVKKQLATLQRIQKTTFSQLSTLRTENQYFVAKEKKRANREAARMRSKLNGNGNNTGSANGGDEDVEMSEADDESEPDHVAAVPSSSSSNSDEDDDQAGEAEGME